MRKPFIAGNWKMNTNRTSSVELVKAVADGCSDIAGSSVDVAVYPPFVYLQSVIQAANTSYISVGGQDMYYEKDGAFTGEISAAMLKDVGCVRVLCGHSERRHVIGENDALINKKVLAAINGGLLPTLCVGELLEERKSGKTEEVVRRQLKVGLGGICSERLLAVTIAYEPVWAIGTGLTATPEQAQEVHAFIRKLLSSMYDKKAAETVRIQYGGSVKADNAAELMGKPDVDGLLVGGASLKAADFISIVKASAR